MSDVKVVLMEDSKVIGIYNWPSDWRQSVFLDNPPIEYIQLGEDTTSFITVGWRYVGGDFLPPLDTSSNFGRIITVLAYRKRFTRAERVAIKHASRQASVQSSGLASDLDDLMAATYINLDIQDTINATHDIETATLIAAGRANIILSDPVYSAELPSQIRLKYGLPEIPTEIEMLVNGGKGYTTVVEFFNDNPEYK